MNSENGTKLSKCVENKFEKEIHECENVHLSNKIYNHAKEIVITFRTRSSKGFK